MSEMKTYLMALMVDQTIQKKKISELETAIENIKRGKQEEKII